jgi:hypothetical protein
MAEGWVDTPYLEQLTAHVEKCVGKVDNVLHEIVSDVVHVDVLIVEPTVEKPYYTVVTAGMSSLPMKIPKETPGEESFKYSELMMTLPSTNSTLSGKESKGSESDPPDYYSISDLKRFARYPHQADTWVGPGHTLVSADPPEPLGEDTKMTGYIVGFPFSISSHECWHFTASDGNRINLLQMYAVHTRELEYKFENSSDALFEKLEQGNALGPYDPKRESVIPRKKFLGYF